jgi:hypothetical protein
VHDDLIDWNERVSRKRVIRLIQEDDVTARVRKRYNITTTSDHDQPVADNLLKQEFTAQRPNQRGFGDPDRDRDERARCTSPSSWSVLAVRRRLGGLRL